MSDTRLGGQMTMHNMARCLLSTPQCEALVQHSHLQSAKWNDEAKNKNKNDKEE